MTADFPSGLRIGCVPYLNARPLVWGIEGCVQFDVPSVLSDRFSAGDLDVALLPVFEVLRLPAALVVDGLSISARGPVRSVMVAHRAPLGETPEIILDPDSRSSSNLLRLLLGGYFQSPARLVSSSTDPDCARLMIGDPALSFRRDAPKGWILTDLSEAWHQWTGRPFVFAVWVIAAAVAHAAPVAEVLRRVAGRGLATRAEIAAAFPDPESSLDYLTHAIRFDLGDAEKSAIASFRDALVSYGICPTPGMLPTYV